MLTDSEIKSNTARILCKNGTAIYADFIDLSLFVTSCFHLSSIINAPYVISWKRKIAIPNAAPSGSKHYSCPRYLHGRVDSEDCALSCRTGNHFNYDCLLLRQKTVGYPSNGN